MLEILENLKEGNTEESENFSKFGDDISVMNKDLKKRIKEFNKIPNYDNSKRIIVCTLKPQSMTIASNNTK